MWVKPKRYTALLFGSPDHYERVVFTSIDGGWGDFELLRYNGKIPRSRYVIVYDRKYAIAQSERLSAIMKNEWNYIISEFKTIIPDKNDPEFGSTKKRAKWVVIHFSAIAKQVKRAAAMEAAGACPPDSAQRISAGPSAYNAGALPGDIYEYDDFSSDDDENPSDYDDYDDSFSWTTEIPDADIESLHGGYSDTPSGTVTPTKGFKVVKNRSAHNLYCDDQNAELYKQSRSSHQQLPASQYSLPTAASSSSHPPPKQIHPADASPAPRSSAKADGTHDVLPWIMPHSQPSSPGLGAEGEQIFSEECPVPSPVPDKQQQYPPALPISVQLNNQKFKPQAQNEGIIAPTPAHGSTKKKPSPLHQTQTQIQQQLKTQCQKQLLQSHQQQEQQQQQQKLQVSRQETAKNKSFTVRLVDGIAREAAGISMLWKRFWNHFVESWLYVHYIYIWVVALTEEAPTKEQRTKKYIVYSCLAATLASFVLHYSHGALFLVEIIALNYACVYCVRNRADLVKKTIVLKASNAKERKITRIIRAVQGKDQKGAKNVDEKEESSSSNASASAQATSQIQVHDGDIISSVSPSPLSVTIPGTSSQIPVNGGCTSSSNPKKLTKEEKKEIKEEKEREKKEIKEEKEREKKEIKEEKEREKKELKEEKEREKKELKEGKEREKKEIKEEKEREKKEIREEKERERREKEEKERERKEKKKEEKASLSLAKDEKKGVLGRLKWKRASQMINTDYNVGAPESSFTTYPGGEIDGVAPFDYPVDESSDASFNQERRPFSDEDDDDDDDSNFDEVEN